MGNLDEIRARLVDAIRKSELTQKELANQIGVCQQSVAQYLSGRAMPSLDTFAKICIVLELDPAEILGV